MSGSEKIGDNFSEDWKNAMSGREVTPPDSVWAGIDRSLANAELAKYKKKAGLYKWAAVIALLLAATVSVSSLFDFTSENSVLSNDNNTSNTVATVDEVESDFLSLEQPDNSQNQKIIENDNKGSNSYSTGNGSMLGLFTSDTGEENSIEPSITNDFSLSRISNVDFFAIDGEDILATKKAPQKFYIFRKFIPGKNTGSRDKSKLWAGVEIGSGSYNPNFQVDNTNSIAATMLASPNNSFVNPSNSRVSTPSIEESMSAGINYQVGVNVGMRIVENWTLESGVQYAMAQTTTNTNILIENRFAPESVALTSEAASTTEVADITEQQEIIEYREEDLPLQNTFQFASFPLKAGYIIMDKKVTIQLKAGMIANVYLGNSLRDQSNRVATMDIDPGAESPYRDLSFSGITGLTMGYEFMDRLHLTIEPNYTHALSPFTKTSSNIDFSPTGLGVMAGIRYRLR